MRTGNAAHEVRNLLARKKRPDIPELIVIDQVAGDIEGKCREIIISM